MKVIVCGGGDFKDRAGLFEALSSIHAERPIDTVITSYARGADRLAAEWAEGAGVQLVRIRADFSKPWLEAVVACNREMLALGPDLVVAFAGGQGTADMVAAGREAGVQVQLLTDRL